MLPPLLLLLLRPRDLDRRLRARDSMLLLPRLSQLLLSQLRPPHESGEDPLLLRELAQLAVLSSLLE